MYKIKYYNMEVIEEDFNKTNEHEYKKELRELEYTCKNDEFEYWLDVIQNTYSKYGEVTHEHVEDEATKEELEKKELKAEIKTLKEQLLEIQTYVVDKEYNNLLENGGIKDVI